MKRKKFTNDDNSSQSSILKRKKRRLEGDATGLAEKAVNKGKISIEKPLNGMPSSGREAKLQGVSKDDCKAKIKRRPWRQAVRHKAKRERKEREGGKTGKTNLRYLAQDTRLTTLEGEGTSTSEPNGETIGQTKLKQKRPSRRNRLKRKSQVAEAFEKLREEGEDNGQAEEAQRRNVPTARLMAARFRYLNEQLYTRPSSSAVELFKREPEAFEAYHLGYKQQLRKWPVHPLQTLLMDMSSLSPGTVIADLGCGDAELARQLGDHCLVHSFDLKAANERVVVTDMANLPLESATVDLCVYCLSLMGTNLAHFFREAHRVLKMHGKVKVVEIMSRFSNIKHFIGALEKMGFQLKRKKEIGNGFFVMLTLEKTGRIQNKRPQGLHLEPCLYKKR